MGDLHAFREDTRRWLEEHAPPSMRTPPASADAVCWGAKKGRYPDDVRCWLEVMAERTVPRTGHNGRSVAITGRHVGTRPSRFPSRDAAGPCYRSMPAAAQS
jgi:hypothetical protein